MIRGLITFSPNYGERLKHFQESLHNLRVSLSPKFKKHKRIQENLERLEKRVLVRKRITLISTSGWGPRRVEAFLEGNAMVRGEGRTKSEALGDLVRRWGHKFGVEVRDLC